jgi:uncharacterized protein (DUF58 family)
VRRRRLEGEAWAAALFAALAAAGWWDHSVLLAASGTLGVVCVLLLWVWQRECLTNVRFGRTLSHDRAMFAEEVTLSVEVVNDKVLPLTWLHIEDVVPRALPIRGGTVDDDASRREAVLHLFVPMLPFARARRRFVVTCDRRGEHTFGPALLESGDPVAYARRFAKQEGADRLLVYPKVFLLEPPGIASRVLLGDHRSRATLVGDPSRVAGVREYRPGDPLRHVDWRATARSPSLLVRVHEPTTSLRVAVFVDLRVPRARHVAPPDLDEFTVAVAASVVSDLAQREIGVGLYATGAVDGRPVACPARATPSALADMLQLLARVSVFGTVTVAELLAAEAHRLRSGTSVVVIAAHFPEPTVAAIAELRRRLPVTALWVGNDAGAPPPVGTVDAREEVAYVEDWKQRATLELVG